MKASSVVKIIIYVVLIIVSLFLFKHIATRLNKTEDFNKFIETSDTYQDKTFPSGTSFSYSSLKFDSDKYYVLLDIYPVDNENMYEWASLTPAQQTADMRYAAEAVISYAKHKNWDNNYYLYTSCNCGVINFAYNYETDTLYRSEYMDLYNDMYDKFGTMSIEELKGNPKGEEYLLKNDLAKMKHNEIERTFYDTSCFAFIDDQGEFHLDY